MPSQPDPIRVLLIAPSLQITGGQAVQALRLRAALGHDPSLLVDFQPIGPDPPAWLGPIRRMRVIRTVARWVTYVCALLARVRGYAVVHVFSAGMLSYTLWTLPALAVAKLYRRPIILNYRDGRADDHLRWPLTIFTVRRMSAVVAPSAYLVDVFARHGLTITTISNILDPSRFQYRPRRVLRPTFLHNRILETLYNVPCTLRAFQLVQQQYPDASLTVAHDGNLRPSLEALARELNLKNTRFIGTVPPSEIPALYDAADIYLTSPDIDCMPGSILECFASGLPVVATGTGGIPYIASDGQTALLVPAGDHEAMARAALRLLGDPDLVERLTANARATCARYADGPVREQWSALYHRLSEAS
jgi:glycosyltransferase involved in cell wall biosynthesis